MGIRPTDTNKINEDKANAVFCPNCGVPRSTTSRLETFLSQKKKLRWKCNACGVVLTMERGWPEEEKKGVDISIKDVISTANAAKKVIGIIKSV